MKGLELKFIRLCLEAGYDGCSAGIIAYTVYNLYNESKNSPDSSVLSLITQWLVFVAQISRYLVIIANIANAEIRVRQYEEGITILVILSMLAFLYTPFLAPAKYHDLQSK